MSTKRQAEGTESPGVVNINLDLPLSFRQGHFPYRTNNLQKNPVSFKKGESGKGDWGRCCQCPAHRYSARTAAQKRLADRKPLGFLAWGLFTGHEAVGYAQDKQDKPEGPELRAQKQASHSKLVDTYPDSWVLSWENWEMHCPFQTVTQWNKPQQSPLNALFTGCLPCPVSFLHFP